MEVAAAELVNRMRAHVDAARRQREAARTYPEAHRGFMRSARFHIAEAGTLAETICAAQACRPARSQL